MVGFLQHRSFINQIVNKIIKLWFRQTIEIHIWGSYFAEYGSHIPYVRVQVCACIKSRNYLELPESLQGSSSGRHSNWFDTSPSLPSLSALTRMGLLRYVMPELCQNFIRFVVWALDYILPHTNNSALLIVILQLYGFGSSNYSIIGWNFVLDCIL